MYVLCAIPILLLLTEQNFLSNTHLIKISTIKNGDAVIIWQDQCADLVRSCKDVFICKTLNFCLNIIQLIRVQSAFLSDYLPKS